MPGDVTPLAIGIFGKIPVRGDFVRAGLPRDFVDTWDSWLTTVMSATRQHAGEAWLPAFLEAPIWRFSLPAGLCGAGAVIGVMIPSVDRAGRYFPLTVAAVGPVSGFIVDAAAGVWLDRCETAGLAALERDAEPDAILAILGVPALSTRQSPTVRELIDSPPSWPGLSGPPVLAPAAPDDLDQRSKWWSDGAPRVPAGTMTLTGLPEAAVYAEMLGLSSAKQHLVQAGQPKDMLE